MKCYRRRLEGLYRLKGSVQTGGVAVRHGSSGISKKNGQKKAIIAQRYAKQAQEYLKDVLGGSRVVQECREMLWDTCVNLDKHEWCNQCMMSIKKLIGRRQSRFIGALQRQAQRRRNESFSLSID